MGDLKGKPEVLAAGGIVVRERRVLLVHRPRYDDWTFPKGKLDKGETLAECALREVIEETGLQCQLGEPLVTNRYYDAKNRLKEVHYWLMTVTGGSFEVNDEVDEVMWTSGTQAADLLSYSRDAEVLAAALEHIEA